MVASFGGYELLADKIPGYIDALNSMRVLGYEVTHEEPPEYYDSNIRGAVRFSRFAVIRSIPLQTIISEVLLGENPPFTIDIYSQKAIEICHPIYSQIIYHGFERRDRIDGDIGLYSAYLQGRGLDPEEFELELYDKYEKAFGIAISLNMSRLASLSPKNNARLS